MILKLHALALFKKSILTSITDSPQGGEVAVSQEVPTAFQWGFVLSIYLLRTGGHPNLSRNRKWVSFFFSRSCVVARVRANLMDDWTFSRSVWMAVFVLLWACRLTFSLVTC